MSTDTTHASIGADALRKELIADLREVFDASGQETPQIVRDVIEYADSWLHAYIQRGAESAAAGAAHPEAPAAQRDAEDAARYRWLRELKAHANPPIHGSAWVVKYHQQPGTIPELRSAGFGEVLDATIDAARAAKEGDQHG